VLDAPGEAPIEATTSRAEALVFNEEPDETPTVAQSIEAPIADRAHAERAQEGVLDGAESLVESRGEGEGGGAGTGRGTGVGPGEGPGVGEGSGGGMGGGPYRLGAGVEPPIPIRTVRPDYTREAILNKLEGDVVVEVVVRRDGTVDQLRILKSLDPGLDQKAIEAAREWRFLPGKLKGQPVDVLVDIVVAFRLY
jgi:TonB family protein